MPMEACIPYAGKRRMRIAISVMLAFVLSGIAEVVQDLRSRPIDRPMWVTQPTLGKAILIAVTWFTTPFLKVYYSTGQKARAVAFGTLAAIGQMSILTGLIWLCISAATHVFDSAILQVVSTTVFIVVGFLFVLSLANLILLPLMTLIVGWPLDLLFPLKGRNDGRAIEWCPNCKHHRKSRDFGDFMGGLCQSKIMPRSDKLPCSIALETSSVWEQYYSSEPGSRTLLRRFCRWRPRG